MWKVVEGILLDGIGIITCFTVVWRRLSMNLPPCVDIQTPPPLPAQKLILEWFWGRGNPEKLILIVINTNVCGRSEGGRRWGGMKELSFGRTKKPCPRSKTEIGEIQEYQFVWKSHQVRVHNIMSTEMTREEEAMRFSASPTLEMVMGRRGGGVKKNQRRRSWDAPEWYQLSNESKKKIGMGGHGAYYYEYILSSTKAYK